MSRPARKPGAPCRIGQVAAEPVTVRLPPETIAAIERQAAVWSMSRSDMLRLLIVGWSEQLDDRTQRDTPPA